MKTKANIIILLILTIALISFADEKQSVVKEGAQVKKLAGDFVFTEGPAADAQGNIYFTDIPDNKIHIWSVGGELSTFLEDSGGANGLFFDKDGNLIACQGAGRALVSINKRGMVTILAYKYEEKNFNSLNDLWIDPKGGVYFTDPRYGSRENMGQDGEHVYYLSPDRKKVTRVINDMVKPNGLIGTPDGKTLYVTDAGGGKTFSYSVNQDGTLTNKKLFVEVGCDGMTIDNKGNVYLASNAVLIYNRDGEKLEEIAVSEKPSNLCFGGKDRNILFITARTSLYSIPMQVKGVGPKAGLEIPFERDTFQTDSGPLTMYFIGHATLIFDFNGKIIHIDPVGREADYSKMPKADFILITHEHGDHLDPQAISLIRKETTQIILTKTCAERVSGGIIMSNGDKKAIDGIEIKAVPAYNIVHMRSAGNPYHPKGIGNGYVITLGGKNVYVAGDTENTPEMKQLTDIDIAFLPMNLPYTMTPEMVADAAKAFKPKVLYPYHYGNTETGKLVELLKNSPEIEVRIRDLP